MKLFASLDAKDRRMLLITLGLVAVLFSVLAIFTPGEDPNKNPIPNSYLTGQHGAKAAFTLLQQSGYTVERWEQPLSDLAALAAQSGPRTVLILAEPDAQLDKAVDLIPQARALYQNARKVVAERQAGQTSHP